MGATGKNKAAMRASLKRATFEKVDTLSTESHMQMFDRLVAAGVQGIHNPPGKNPKKS